MGTLPCPPALTTLAIDPQLPPAPLLLRRRCGHCLSFVPWWALLSLALLVGGLTIFVLKAGKASDEATALLAAVAADTATGWPQFMSIYKQSVWPTVGVAGAAIAAVVFAASVRLDQKLRKVGKYGGSKGERADALCCVV